MTDKEYLQQLIILFSCIVQGDPIIFYNERFRPSFRVFVRGFYHNTLKQWIWMDSPYMSEKEMELFIQKKDIKDAFFPVGYCESNIMACDIWESLRNFEGSYVKPLNENKNLNIALAAKIKKVFLPRDKTKGSDFISFFSDEINKGDYDVFSSE